MRKISGYSNFLVGVQLIGMLLGIMPWGGLSVLSWFPGSLILFSGLLMVYWVINFNRVGNFSIFPEPLEHAELITGGPYKLLRHPMYTSLFLIMAGIALINGQILNWAGFILVIFAVLQKIPREERFLRSQFEDYQEFCKGRYRLIPYIW